MSKIIYGFVGIFMLFYFGINAVRGLSGKERLVLTKTIIYSIICASAAVGSIALIVFLF